MEIMRKKHENFTKKYDPFKRVFFGNGWLMASWICVNARGRTALRKIYREV